MMFFEKQSEPDAHVWQCVSSTLKTDLIQKANTGFFFDRAPPRVLRVGLLPPPASALPRRGDRLVT